MRNEKQLKHKLKSAETKRVPTNIKRVSSLLRTFLSDIMIIMNIIVHISTSTFVFFFFGIFGARVEATSVSQPQSDKRYMN